MFKTTSILVNHCQYSRFWRRCFIEFDLDSQRCSKNVRLSLGVHSYLPADSITHPHLIHPSTSISARGGVAVIPDFIPPNLITALRTDARYLFETGEFQPDGLTNTALAKTQQGFTSKADRQTFRGGADWITDVGDLTSRTDFRNRMGKIREQLAAELDRPSLKMEGERRHEMTYNWYEPGALLGRHLDEHHEETKGVKGWLLGTRRSVTWLVYLNDGWEEMEGGALRCYPRKDASSHPVGSHEGNLQVGWLEGDQPVFLDCFRSSGMSALYRMVNDERQVLSRNDFDVPGQPIEFSAFLPIQHQAGFEQISSARLDPRFARASGSGGPAVQASLLADSKEQHSIDIVPTAGTLVLFDSVSLPHLVREVTSSRQRIAATGWFHEDSQFQIGT